MRVAVKICGVTTPESAREAADAGVDALGFVFAESSRRVGIEQALEIAAAVPPFVTLVAVFRHPEPDEVRRVVEGFAPHLVQTEPDDRLADLPRWLPVFHDGADVQDEIERFVARDASPRAIHFEAAGRGGRGIAPDWNRAAALARRVPLVLAGGLGPDNVAEAIRKVRPRAVDVSSGVESAPGVKGAELMRRFVAAVRREERDEAGESS